MGLGKLVTRLAAGRDPARHDRGIGGSGTTITATDTATGATQTFFIDGGIAPRFATANHYQGGMGIPGAWRAANLLAGLGGQIPWDAFSNYADKDMEKLTPTPLILDQPNPPDTRMTSFRGWWLDYIWHGNAVGIKTQYNAAGWPTAILPLNAMNVSVRRVGNGDISPFPVGTVEYAVGELRFPAERMFHVKGPAAPGELRGMGVLEAQWEALTLAKDIQTQASKIANHGVPTGVLTVEDDEMTDAEAAAYRGKWMAQTAGGGIAVLNDLSKFQPLAWDPEKLQLVQSRQMTLGELELIFGLPVGWLGGMTSARQYSNIEQDAVNLLKFTLGEGVTAFEQVLSLCFPRGTSVRGNMDFVLRADTLTRYQAYAIGLAQKFLEVDEVRQKEHLPPMPPPPPAPLPPIQATAVVGNPTQALPSGGMMPPAQQSEGA